MMNRRNGIRLVAAGLVVLPLCSYVPRAVAMPETPVITTDSGNDMLKQSGWFGQVQENIRKAEYYITMQEKSVIAGESGGLHAANRAHNLRAYFRENGIQLVDRRTGSHTWQWNWHLVGYGRGDSLSPVSPVIPTCQGKRRPVGSPYHVVYREAGSRHQLLPCAAVRGEMPESLSLFALRGCTQNA